MTHNHNLLLTLDDIKANDLALVGGKSLTLANLARNRFNVLPGLVITSAFFEAQIKHLAYTPVWAGSADVAVTEASLEFLADLLKATPLAPKLDELLKTKLEAMFPADVHFAVRSSAVDEDRQNFSFAGAYLTELTVPRDLLAVSITRCWASALTGTAIKYRLERGLSLQKIKTAVLIQPMLQAEVAGVGFTLNPMTGERNEMVIEAHNGAAHEVVVGQITPFRYRLRKQANAYPIIQKISGDSHNVTSDPLTVPQLNLLAKTLIHLEALQGTPQDVEWAFVGQALYLFQARPITAIADRSTHFFDTEWTRANHLESLPDIPSPLFMSMMKRSQVRGLQFFADMGLQVSDVGAYLTEIYGRPYLNLSMVRRILSQLGFNPWPLLSLVGYTDRPSDANPFRIQWQTVWQARHIYRRLFSEVFRLKPIVATYVADVEQIVAALAPADGETSPGELLEQFRLREQVYGGLISTGLVLVAALSGLTILIGKIVGPLAKSPNDVMRTLAKLGGSSAANIHGTAMLRMSRLARQEPDVLTYLTRPNNDFSDYRTALAETRLLTELDTYFAHHGDRATYEPDMSYPRYREQPRSLLRAINHYVQLGTPGSEDDPPEQEQLPKSPHKIWQTLTAHVPLWKRWLTWRWLFGLPLVALLRALFVMRDSARLAEAQGMAAVRAWDVAWAKQWVSAGYLESVADYFWLHMEEIEKVLVTEDDAGLYFKPTVQVRRESYRSYANIRMPLVIKDSQVPQLSQDIEVSHEILSEILVGLPVSPGQAQGTIRILEEVDRLDQVPQGSILVTPSTDPALLPYFPLAAGLIVEVGGMLSHGSIIAREYGVPAVSNIVDARQHLRNGDRVLLDGSTGIVQILESQPE